MTTSTDGQICYGMLFEEDFQFPWDEKHPEWIDFYQGDIEDWWIRLNGYKPLFQMFDENENWFNFTRPSKEEIGRYNQHKRKYKIDNPLPVELVDYCGNEYSMYIVAIKSSVIIARRGYPVSFIPSNLVINKQDEEFLIRFIKEYLKIEPNLKWYLSSFWGQ